MSDILTEKELVSNKKLSWGQWEFSLSSQLINDKISSLSHVEPTRDCNHWINLFSKVHDKSNKPDSNSGFDIPLEIDSPMECSPITITGDEKETIECTPPESSSVEDISVCLLDLCNQVAPKLRFGLDSVREEMLNLANDLKNLNEKSVILLMDNSWPQLSSNVSKMCFCIPFTSSSKLCEILCKRVLLPWLSRSPPNKLEQLSEILSTEGDTVCFHLVVPLLKTENSALVQDLFSLEELMTSMTQKHWTVVLKEFLSGLADIQKWQVPVLVAVVEHAKPTDDDVFVLVQLVSSAGSIFSESRDFGALLVVVANCLKSGSGSLVSQFKLVANNYKGPMKFKVLKILADIKD